MERKLYSAGILGVGAIIPTDVRKNDFWDDVNFELPEGKDPFRGMVERRIFKEDLLPSDVETEAGILAINNSGLNKEDIDLVIVQSMVPDEILPEDACIVQYKIGLPNAGAWTIDTCCSSFVTAVVTASNLIATGEFKNILIINSALCSRHVDKGDYLSTGLGDGVGAIVMGQVSNDKGYIASACNANGAYHKSFVVKVREPNYKGKDNKGLGQYLTYNGELTKDVGRTSVADVKEVIEKALEKANITGNDIGLFLSHQPCSWAHGAWRDSVSIPAEKSYESFSKYANIGSASIPVNLYEAVNKGMIKDGDYLLIASPGAGVTHIAAILKWGK